MIHWIEKNEILYNKHVFQYESYKKKKLYYSNLLWSFLVLEQYYTPHISKRICTGVCSGPIQFYLVHSSEYYFSTLETIILRQDHFLQWKNKKIKSKIEHYEIGYDNLVNNFLFYIFSDILCIYGKCYENTKFTLKS